MEIKQSSNFLLQTCDADAWAKEFCRLNVCANHGMMLSWFACAIETGRSFGQGGAITEIKTAEAAR